MTRILKQSTVLNLQLVQDNDGVYEVRHGDEVLQRTRVESLALITFAELNEELGASISDKMRGERSYFDMQAARSDSFARRAANAQKKGGKGGRGGV